MDFDFDDLANAFEDNGTSTLKSKTEEISAPTEDEIDIKRAEKSLSKFIKRRSDLDGNDEIPSKKRKEEESVSKPEHELAEENRIKIYDIESLERCLHKVAVPPDVVYQPLRKTNRPPAKTYPFILDPFQKEAIHCLENHQSVLVSAHTSAGKTVVAEYAVAMSIREKQRVIYTTPIKALSNQKYQEFSDQFQDVGIMTGDVTLNPNASCLIMTTEILQSMLYRGSEIIREIGWVVFDEIHYMRDKERGRVWEETLILIPDSVRFVFLSATIPNGCQFAEWVSTLHKQPCHVVYTDYRPVPLKHYLYPCGSSGLHLILDEKGVFREENFLSAMSTLSEAGEASKGDQVVRRRVNKSNETNCYKIVKLVMERNLDPCIVFSFSKKECEIYALQMAKLDFNTAEEKKLVDIVFHNATQILSEDDRRLPQVESVLPLLKKGIGIHHSGLLPLIKETVELLFSEGLIKCLFATETFAMGLNMPARTVVFTSARKFDGKDYRWITSGEYIQMSGRAGRRGLDDKGTVILMVDENMSQQAGKQIVKGNPDPLNSAYYLTYNMILNLMRVEEINPEYMLEKSFFQFQNYATVPEILERKNKLVVERDAIEVQDEEDVASYFQIKKHLDALRKEQWAMIQQPKFIVPFMQPGRLVHVISKESDYGWGVVLNIVKKQERELSNPFYVVDCLLRVWRDAAGTKPCPEGEDGEAEIVPIKLDLIFGLSAVRVFVPKDLMSAQNRRSVLKSVDAAKERFGAEMPMLNPVQDMKIREARFVDLMKKVDAFQERLDNHWLHDTDKLKESFPKYEMKMEKEAQIAGVEKELDEKKSLLQREDLLRRKRVLRRLQYCSNTDVVTMKGRVACEISGADELLLTELLFNGVFNDLSVPHLAALLSCFVFEEKASEMPSLTEELGQSLRCLQDTARRIVRVCRECKMEVEEEIYVDSFKPHMMDLVAAWCGGVTFAHIIKMTDIFEGSIIRCMRRLEELLREMCNAAKAIGNSDLENKFAEAILAIKRDIVFAGSLYL